jgi:fimbrial chaperone protein
MAGFRNMDSFMAVFRRTFVLAFLLFMIAVPPLTYAGQWRVTPVRIFLDRRAKSCVITLLNDGEDTVHLQGKAMSWTQGADGRDVYEETRDLIFFPRLLKLDKGEQKIIRAGVRVPATSREKTYRLFIEEIPQPNAASAGSSQLTVAVRFGIPVFAKPLREKRAADLASVSLNKGEVNAVVANSGNIHFRITDITVQGVNGTGEETFSEKLNGWYLLAGASRSYAASLSAQQCGQSERIDITVATDSDITLHRSLHVDKAQCLP